MGIGTLGLSLKALELKKPAEVMAQQILYPYRSWEDVYRERWTWDRIAKVTHPINCWYQAHCSWNAYVKDGIVWREEQSADYPQTKPELPDFNPRGCQKGCCYSERMYSPCRIKYPLKRMGERGEGKWKRVSWDEALTEIADTIIDVITNEGHDCVVAELCSNINFSNQGLSFFRFLNLLDTTFIESNPEVGNDHQGAGVTFGKIIACGSADDWFYADIFLIWGGNPHYTGIPYSHFLWEARYNGTKVIGISPDYNPSAMHTDVWIPINVGTDACLALSLAHVIVEERLYDEKFIKEQTDLPILVRTDNKLLLRERDLKEGGREDVFYFYDLKTKNIKEVPKTTLSLGGMEPALEGDYEIDTIQGRVKVVPVFELLRERLKVYFPENASKITGVNPSIIEDLARDIAKAKSVTNMTNTTFTKAYHGDLIQRAQILVLALCGHFGKKGSGFNAFPMLEDYVAQRMAMAPFAGSKGLEELERAAKPLVKKLKEKGYTEEMIIYEFARKIYEDGGITSAVLFWYIHGGLKELSGRSKQWDPYLKKDADEYVKEALERGWQYISPPPEKEPRILIEYGGNIIRRVRGYPVLLKNLWPKLKLILTIDWRMSSTGLYSDFVLPACGWYEKTSSGAGWISPLLPFFQICEKAVEPLHESKSDWEIFCLLAKKIQQRAKQRGISTFKGRKGMEKRLDTLYDDMTFSGYYDEKSDEKVAEDCIRFSKCIDAEWKELKRKGWTRWADVGDSPLSIGNAYDMKPNETNTVFTWHTEKKIPYPTLTRRMQFYIDHELYLELGEELPVHKDPPKTGGNYPLTMTGGHTRWSIHSLWRDDAYMLRLQRAEPVMYMNAEDAAQRGIRDGEEVLVKNDIDSFNIHVKVSPAVRPGQVIIYHAWEKFQFKHGKMFQNLMPSPINPVELAGGYFHIRPLIFQFHPGQSDRDTRVEVVKIAV